MEAARAAATAANAQLVIESLPRAVVIVDAAGTVVGWNQVATRLYGYVRADAIGRSMFDLITPADLQSTARQILHDVLAGQAWRGDVPARHRSGSTILTYAYLTPLCDADGAVVGVVGAADDRSELLRLEQHASQLADQLLLALQAGQLGTWRYDRTSGRTVWDPVLERLFGMEPGTFSGTYEGWTQMLHPDDAGNVIATVEEAMATGSSYEVEYRAVLPDGTVRWHHARGQATVDAHGRSTGTIGCATDITDRKLAEANTARRMREAEESAAKERRQRERLEFLAHLNEVALQAPDRHALMRAVTAAAVPHLGDWCAVHFLPEPGVAPERHIAHADPTRQRWADRMLEDFPFDPTAPTGVPAVIRNGVTEFVPVVDRTLMHEAIRASGRPNIEQLHEIADALDLTSIITAPLLTRRGVVGAIQFVSAETRRRYDDEDRALAEAVAGRVAEALVNAWLMDQQRMIASTLQSALLPQALPDLRGASVAARYWAAGALSEVGGDFYDLFAIADDEWAIVIGDVCGTGPRAAAVTAIARHTIRAAATHGVEPADVLSWVNDAIRHSNKDLFCTAVFATLRRHDAGGWALTMVVGGHPLPVLVRADGTASMVGHVGTLIGVLPSIEISPVDLHVRAGDTLVLYTDGVTDVRNPYALDDAQLLQMVAAAVRAGGTADGTARELGVSIQRVLPIPDRHDDVALLVLRFDDD